MCDAIWVYVMRAYANAWRRARVDVHARVRWSYRRPTHYPPRIQPTTISPLMEAHT